MANPAQLLGRLFKRNYSPENPRNSLSTWVANLFGSRTSSGASVTTDTAITLIAIYACNKILGESMASMQVEVMEKNSDGTVREAVDHPVYRLVKKGLSLYSWNTFVETGQVHCGMTGNMAAEIISNNRGEIVDLKLLDTRKCPGPTEVEGRIIYKFDKTQFTPEEILHIPNLGFTGLWGLSPIDVAKETIGVGLETVTYSANVFNNGGSLQGYLKHPTEISESAAKRISQSWNARYMGGKNAGKTPLLEEGMEFIPLTMSPADVRLIEQSNYIIEEIARLYRVPQHLIGKLDKSSFNNIETQSLEFVMHTLRPWAKRWEAELNRKLFTDREQDRYFIRFNIDSLLRGDSKSRAEYLRTLYMIGVLSPNDIRKILKLNPIEGGDVYLHQGAMMSTEQILNNGNNEREETI